MTGMTTETKHCAQCGDEPIFTCMVCGELTCMGCGDLSSCICAECEEEEQDEPKGQ